VEVGETLIEAAARELREEGNIELNAISRLLEMATRWYRTGWLGRHRFELRIQNQIRWGSVIA
jgi:8-oxo-dGTP pyrophosphatase MutT (NUDIX family)